MWRLINLLFARYDLHQLTASAADLELGFKISICNLSLYLLLDLEEVVGDPTKGHQSVVLAFNFVDNLKSTCGKLLDFIGIHPKFFHAKWVKLAEV